MRDTAVPSKFMCAKKPRFLLHIGQPKAFISL